MQEEIEQLNELLQLCRSAEKGYQTAAEQVEDAQTRNTLAALSKQRNEFAYKLDQQIRIQGGEPVEEANIIASAHRIWINIRGMLPGENATAIIRECLRGEKECIEFYESTLNKTTFSNDTRLLLANQMKSIRETREKLEKLLPET
ncbi:ferritin-like domain-containing protein [Flavilitoribacter nigricans]|uniref:DUF2383 domain-containing protein n=1 Tax=Flavilitoribacter nigricans (strain ATCC 23147 / DSM 23189 / NBRC 102662 / NCIMB 1420 / SS-2) TaxID=1122177 RepID=A0A2D0N9J5_FLAN2|nr:PA2169 family four-helix-bundle protein [Flavilitoribacter nigricans]PHN05050.1 hypothetical protein CRP01_18675 [Flavilitoribacter nigricans DSM 23189 = NBRC 102662]